MKSPKYIMCLAHLIVLALVLEILDSVVAHGGVGGGSGRSHGQKKFRKSGRFKEQNRYWK